MNLLFKAKDGGPDSKVTGYWLIEWKRVFSIVLLRFDRGGREVMHTHAFNACSWVLSGSLTETYVAPNGPLYLTKLLNRSILPVYTSRHRLHSVEGNAKRTWVLSFRGPWSKTWFEWDRSTQELTTLQHGRKPIGPANQ